MFQKNMTMILWLSNAKKKKITPHGMVEDFEAYNL